MRTLPLLRRSIVASLAAALTLGGCREAVSGLGAAEGQSAATTNDLLNALAVRFGVAYRDPRFETIRPKMVRHALSPSRLYPDTTVWTSIDGDVRTVSVAGSLDGGRYILAVQDSVPRPALPGDSRHLMHLRRLGDGIHQWDSSDEVAIGSVRAAEVFGILEGARRGLERPAEEIRNDYRTAFPYTTAIRGRLATLDSLRTITADDGSTSIALVVRIDPDRMRPFAPQYADYLDEYLRPLRIDVELIDGRGTSWGSASFRRNVLRMELRSRDGTLQPLAGATIHPADSLRLRISFFAKVLFFEVGTSGLIAELGSPADSSARGWTLRFRREPRWHFPLAVGRLLRAPLRRPFADEGAMIEYLVRDSSGAQTVLARNIHIVVQESAIIRWLGALGATAMSDLSVEAEQQKDRFIGDVFRAAAEDSRVLLSR